MSQEEEKWYRKGLKFKCTGCGKCCLGKEGYVFVTPREVAEMADFLGISVQVFALKYLRQVGNRFSLLERGKDNTCIFLKDKKTCAVYEKRPVQCQTFPYWPQTLKTRTAWEQEKENCEGIDHVDGELISFEEIEQRHQQQIEAEKQY